VKLLPEKNYFPQRGQNQQIEKFPEECRNCISAWVTGRCGGAEIQFPHSGTAVKPYPGETFRSAENICLPESTGFLIIRRRDMIHGDNSLSGLNFNFPAIRLKTGIRQFHPVPDSGFCRNDGFSDFSAIC
jgi:hypothetical protein